MADSVDLFNRLGGLLVGLRLDEVEELREVEIPNDVSPPYHFSPVVPGMVVDRETRPFSLSAPPPVQRLPSHDKKLLAQAYASPLPGRVGPPRY